MTTMRYGRHGYRGGEPVATGRGSGKGRPLLVVPALVVLWVATALLMMFMPFAAMASDPCNSASEGLICTARGQALCFQIPWIGGPLLGAAGTIAIVTRMRALRYGAVVVWIAGLITMVSVVGSIADTYHPQ
ncbi:MAG: hypothetical protein HOV68_14800 [Streptomycetaceae bacterium]|nr:hypothetical protein [Streptomycetaceae bacterium]